MEIIKPLPRGFVLFSERYKYTIINVIGRGTSGYVYVANMFSPKHNASCQVALKEWASLDCCLRMEDMSISYPQDLKSESLYRNFMDEYTVLTQIDHPNVIHVFDCMCTNGTYYYSMEYLPEGTLEDYILRNTNLIDEAFAIYVVKQIASGLEAFHQKGYVHSDLKLSNIVIRSKDCFVLIDGGANRMDAWVGDGKENMFLADICALANVLLCLLSGMPDVRPEYTKAERMFAKARERSNLTDNTEQAIRVAFSAGFRHIRDFIGALDGRIEPFQNNRDVSEHGKATAILNKTEKAKEFLERMKRLPKFFISTKYVDTKEVERINRGEYKQYGLQKISNWFHFIQDGFVLGLRLPSPDEFTQYLQLSKIEHGTYLTFDSHSVKFYKFEVAKKVFPWQRQEIKMEECDLGIFPENCRFYYVCDLDPLIADTHRIHPFAPETQLFYEQILSASFFGFCKVMNEGKWGVVTNKNWVSMEIDCKYDNITDITYVCIPGPGIPPMFLGAIGYSGEQIDVYELVEGRHLQLKASMTQADWNRRSRYS